MAIEQSAESVVMTDAAARIEYVNPAFERVTGYSAAEVVGRNPRLLQSGRQNPAFYEAMWQTLTAGGAWVGDLVNRRKDGSLFTEEAVISPVHDDAGTTDRLRGGEARRDTRACGAGPRADAGPRAGADRRRPSLAIHPHATPEETADAVVSPDRPAARGDVPPCSSPSTPTGAPRRSVRPRRTAASSGASA